MIPSIVELKLPTGKTVVLAGAHIVSVAPNPHSTVGSLIRLSNGDQWASPDTVDVITSGWNVR